MTCIHNSYQLHRVLILFQCCVGSKTLFSVLSYVKDKNINILTCDSDDQQQQRVCICVQDHLGTNTTKTLTYLGSVLGS